MVGGGYEAGGALLYPVTAPALIVVGSLMVKNVREIPWDDPSEATRPEHLPGNLRQLTSERSMTFAVGTSMEVIERQALLATMREVNGNKAAASRLLGISQRTLYRKIKAYGLNNILPDKKSRLN